MAPEATLFVEGDRVAGTSFCNRYHASVTESSPGEIRVGRLGATRRACAAPADSLERRFQSALGAARKYSFLCGKLAITSIREDVVETLLFAPRPRD